MQFTVLPIIAFLVSWLGCLAAIRGLFGYLEDRLDPDAKKTLSQWVNNLSLASSVTGLPKAFEGVFDRVFGSPFLVARLRELWSGPMLVVSPTSKRAEAFAADVRTYSSGADTKVLPRYDTPPYDR